MPLPPIARALLDGLNISNPSAEGLRRLRPGDWPALVAFCDRSQLTLVLGALHRSSLPPEVRRRIEEDASKNERKFARLKREFRAIAAALASRDIPFVVLKGFTHSPLFTPDPLLRAQGDIDLWCRADRVFDAYAALLALGYIPQSETENRHLPPLVPARPWQWRGDYHDPELPIGVDLHYRLWDEKLERIRAPGVEEFWDRRIEVPFEGGAIQALAPADALAFAALHQLLHVLRGDARLQRAWEIASFLDRHASDEAFWNLWADLHPPALRRLECVVFRLSAAWFGGRLAPRVLDETGELPEPVRNWLDRRALDPVENLFTPNKNELWLHLALIDTRIGRLLVFRRRMFPLRLLHPIDESGDETAATVLQARAARWRWILGRAARHAALLPRTLDAGIQDWLANKGLDGVYPRFQLTALLYDFGAFIFYVLYNLYLIGLGLREDALGMISSAMTAGTMAGTVAAAILARRLGLRNAMLIAILGNAGTSVLRVLFLSRGALLASAFLAGALSSLWAVALFPAVAALSSERGRNFAFSLIFSFGIGAGILGGLAAGRLAALPFIAGASPSLRPALLCACAVISLATLPALGLRFSNAPTAREANIFPRGPFVAGFLTALFVYSLATDLFNPFFNAYLSRSLHMSVQGVGAVFSVSQGLQVCAVLLAPAVLRRLGQVRGIASMQFASALGLAALAAGPTAAAAALLYPVYMAFQYMSDPGISSLLMSGVREHTRGGASALNFLVSSLAGALAALAGGFAITHFGYPSTLSAAALLAAAGALLFGVLVHERT